MKQPDIVWLVSYPQSGSALFRSFLKALLDEQDHINPLSFRSNIFSDSDIFESHTDIDPAYLYDEEVLVLLPEVFTALSNESESTTYIKTENALHIIQPDYLFSQPLLQKPHSTSYGTHLISLFLMPIT